LTDESTSSDLSIFDEAAEIGVIMVLKVEESVFRNELHYRLEYPEIYQLGVRELHHERIDAAVNRLEKKGKITPIKPRGRPPSSRVRENLFYKLSTTPYSRPLQDTMKRKERCSQSISDLASGMGYYAQALWVQAFQELGFNIRGENTNTFNDITAKTPGNIDIIVELDKIFFGVEIKNGLAYPTDIKDKFTIAAGLKLFPIIVARNISYKDRLRINKNGGLFKIYQTSIFKVDYKNNLEDCVKLLGYPLIFTDKIDDSVESSLMSIIEIGLIGIEEYEFRRNRYLEQYL
jgi:hypothetical protein